MMTCARTTLIALITLCLLASMAQARMNAQGVLREADGTLIEGDLAVTFAIYESQDAQAPLWTEAQTVTLVSGVFDSLLPLDPQANPWPQGLFWGDDPRWLEIQPEGQSALPRTLIAAVPRAMSSVRAGVAANALALNCTGCVTSGHLAAQVLSGSSLGFDDSLANLGVGSVQAALDALDAGLDDHAQNPDAHHPANAAGLDIEPSSVTVGDTHLNDGALDLGPGADDSLNAAMVETLTGGGDAEALHTHASAGGGGGGRTGYLGVTNQVRAADVGLPVMNKDCAIAFGAARMCTLSQVLDSYPAPAPSADAWLYWNAGAHTEDLHVANYGTAMVFTHKPELTPKKYSQGAIPRASDRNCTRITLTGPFSTKELTPEGSSPGYYGNELRALALGPDGGIRRVDCDQQFITACCGPL